jgi:hypothetical protein
MAKQAKVLGSSTTLLNVHVFMFTYLFPCKIGTNVCTEILGNKKLSAIFFGRSEIISTRGFFKSCFSNPITNNLEQNGLSKYF